MEKNFTGIRKIAILGLGTVGFSLAAAFGQKQSVIGFDINIQRLEELRKNYDRNHLVPEETLKNLKIDYRSDSECLKEANFHIVAVPTPITSDKLPDMAPLLKASEVLAPHLKIGDIVVYESSVFPGATEDYCIPVLEKYSGLKSNRDFFVGYSPERINPGDPEHTLEKVIKIISAQNDQALEIIKKVYGSIVKAGLYPVSSIKVAESVKIVENVQRDVYIALTNELALILHKLDINRQEVFQAAQTKWNFGFLRPGLVGGSCIGVDTYYLLSKAEAAGYCSELIRSARKVNDSIKKYLVEQTLRLLKEQKISLTNAKIAILGITFKENFPEVENSQTIELIQELQAVGLQVQVHDPIIDTEFVSNKYEITAVPWKKIEKVDAMILTVADNFYKALKSEDYVKKINKPGVLIDATAMLNKDDFLNSEILLWQL